MNGANYLEYVRQGGIAMYPLAICSIVSIAIIIERSWYLMKTGKKIRSVQKAFFGCLDKKDIDGALRASRESQAGEILGSIIVNWGRPIDEIGNIAERKRTETVQAFKRYVWILGTVGSLAPFIGLLGTVTGIIDSFRSIAVSGSGGFTVVSAGISEALIATAAGLIVAVYSVFAYNFFTVRVNNLALSLKLASESCIDELKNLKRT
ncbi:MAG TPA: MotA/TolQ/ExbB proton channel family protein [bacterium]|nr:MotA/TolQ/ExbB proton channel family protein [bacterium]